MIRKINNRKAVDYRQLPDYQDFPFCFSMASCILSTIFVEKLQNTLFAYISYYVTIILLSHL